MIEKIKNKTGTYCGQTLPVRQDTIINKINELVDAVNSIVSVQEKLIGSRFVVETKHEAPADPYAEQRKWIGKVCRFRDYKTDKPMIGVLKDIEVFVGDYGTEYISFLNAADNNTYFECEPVKTDDDIVYKGE